jgi:RNA polymerase sigma-70 factor (ECF subfamily)
MSSSPGAGRGEAFETLVAEVYRPVLRYLVRRTDAATADDVLGDVLLVLWRRFDDIPDEASLPWCYAVARGCLANRLRSDRRHLQLVDRLATATRAETAATPGPALDTALARLGSTDREVLRLWAWEGLPPREIAVVLGISPNAASIRLHRATTRLRTLLTEGKESGTPGQLPDRQDREVLSD